MADVVEQPEGPQPDPLLAELYDSDRPAEELLPKVPLSPLVTAALVTGNPRVRGLRFGFACKASLGVSGDSHSGDMHGPDPLGLTQRLAPFSADNADRVLDSR